MLLDRFPALGNRLLLLLFRRLSFMAGYGIKAFLIAQV